MFWLLVCFFPVAASFPHRFSDTKVNKCSIKGVKKCGFFPFVMIFF